MERVNGGREGLRETGECGVTLGFLGGVDGESGNRLRAYHYSLWSGFEHNFMNQYNTKYKIYQC